MEIESDAIKTYLEEYFIDILRETLIGMEKLEDNIIRVWNFQ